ncbi:pol polyprotein, partial [Tanacetum coccineum]
MNEISCLKVRMVIDTNVTAPMTALVKVTGATVTNTVANHAEKPEKFNRQNFKRWQQKTFLYLTTLNLMRFLNETAPQVEPPTEGQPSNAQAVQATTTAKGLRESLERKYKTEDAGTNKFVVLLHDIHAEGMTVSEAFQVAPIIEKLPPSWDNKLAQKNTYAPDSAKANMVEHDGSSSKSNSKAKGKGKKKNDKKGKGKAEYLALKAGTVKQKFQGTCYNCDQPGHRAANCKMPKVVDNGEKLYMGNSETADIKGEGDVILKTTSEKELKLTNVLYVLEFRRNLVSGWLLNKFSIRLVFESD